GRPIPSGPWSPACAEKAATRTAPARRASLPVSLRIGVRDLAIAGHPPTLDAIVVVDGPGPSNLYELRSRRLDVACLIDRAALDDDLPSVPLPREPKSRVRHRQDWLIECCGKPSPAAIGAHLDAFDAPTPGPGKAADLAEPWAWQRLPARRRRDDRPRLDDESELTLLTVRHGIGIRSGLFLMHEWRVGQLKTAEPFDIRISFPTGKQKPGGESLSDPQRLAVLTVGDHRVGHEFLDRNAACHYSRVRAFGQRPFGPRLHAGLPEQSRDGDARPQAAASKPDEILGGIIRTGGTPPGERAVPGALQEDNPANGREPS